MLAKQAYERLKQAIYGGTLAPGKKIVERDLARRFRISRIPLRESLVRLQAEGLVRSVPYSSSYVEDVEPADALEIYSMRLLIEPLATRLAAIRRPASLLKKLENYCARMQALSKRRSPFELDRLDYDFHHAIVTASGHRRLLRAYESSHIRVLSTRADFNVSAAQAILKVGEEHQKIVEQIAKGNPDAAERLARQHVEVSMKQLQNSLGTSLDQIVRGMANPTIRRVR